MPTVATAGAPDEEIVRSFRRFEGPGREGFITDFLGTKTRIGFHQNIAGCSGGVEGYPIPMNFHGTCLEWAGVLRSVLEASEEYVAIELGAGWGPWLVAGARAARMRGLEKARLVGVEGSSKHCEFMRLHFEDNGLDPAEHRLLHGVAGAEDGVAEFPILGDPSVEWGTAAVFTEQPRRWRRFFSSFSGKPSASGASQTGTERVKCYSLTTLLQPFSQVDLVHVDIQGSEVEVVLAGRAALQKKVKWLVIGTHGRAIEQRLMEELGPQGWALVAEESCKYHQHQGILHLALDGCQVWRNQGL